MTILIITVAMILALTVAGSVAAIVLAVLDGPRQRSWATLMAAGTILISAMALAGWTPVGSFPEIGYSRTSDSFTISIRSGWLFVAPAICSAVALFMIAWKHRTRRAVTSPPSPSQDRK